jgi:DNA repair exonuclease SbcCD nuclease subunit
MIYGIASDLHCHAWSTFATIDSDGVNSRLRIILSELERTAAAIQKAGGKLLVIAGDIFHTRGSLDPEVLNPTQDTFRKILDTGVEIAFIPGNHDLKGKDASALTSGAQTLGETFSTEATVRPFNVPARWDNIAFLPWRESIDELIASARKLAGECGSQLSQTDLIIHAGIDGTLATMPPRGLTAGRLAALGFRRVFAGHYHHHVDHGGGVYSIGATTHQTWSDVNSKAGFLIVSDDKVQFHESRAPRFIDITGMDVEEMEATVPNNYARFRGEGFTPEQLKELKEWLFEAGAKGVSIQVPKSTTIVRTGATGAKSKAVTLDQSVLDYVDAAKDIPAHIDRDSIKRECADVLSSAKAVYEEA